MLLDHDEVEVAAAVVLRAGSTLAPEELVRWCEPRLAYFAIPRYVAVLDDLPRTTNGKIRKAELRRRGPDGLWDRQRATLCRR